MYIFKNKLASKVCVADKVLYQIAGLSKEELDVYQNAEFLSFKQADMANPGTTFNPDAILSFRSGFSTLKRNKLFGACCFV